MYLKDYIKWHFETKLRAIQGLFVKPEKVLAEEKRIISVLNNLDGKVKEWEKETKRNNETETTK